MNTAIVVYQAPQMKNCRNIIVESLRRMFTLSPGRGLLASGQHPNLDRAERHLIAVVLQPDVARRVASVAQVGRELARLDALRPIGTAELVLDDFGAVQPVFHVMA